MIFFRLFGARCTGLNSKKHYECVISRETSHHDLEDSHVIPVSKCDRQAYVEYLENFDVLRNPRLIGQNQFAFPSAHVHQSKICSLARQKKFTELFRFLLDNDCFRNSIATEEFITEIRNLAEVPLLPLPEIIDETSSSEEDDSGLEENNE